jgi:glycosyltransferase involved in cell wall biosynthesis
VRLGHDQNRFLPAAPPAPSQGGEKPERAKRTTKTIVMIGEVEPRKNQAGVLRACRLLAAEFPAERISLTLIGDLSPHCPHQLLKQQLPSNLQIDCLGYVPDEELKGLLQNGDVFVFASLREGFGIPVLEAMSAGVPVVCSENSSLPEVGGPWAFYCDPYDPASIANAIKLAWNLTASQRKRWAAEARAWAEQFTWERCARQFEQLCLQAASRPTHSDTRQEAAGCESSWCNYPSSKGENLQACQAS